MENQQIISANSQELDAIIETRKPLGKFLFKDGNMFIACDNSRGEAWTEEFDTEKKAKDWLNGHDVRECDKCGCEMTQGFVIDGGESYYCDECHPLIFTPKEWEKVYNNGDSDSYWTVFED